jgi:hypothetical protein
MSGDSRGWQNALAELFLTQLRRYRSGEPLANVINKELGFIAGG